MANIASIIEEMLEMMDTIITISANYLTYLLIYSTSYIQFELFFPLTKLILNQFDSCNCIQDSNLFLLITHPTTSLP